MNVELPLKKYKISPSIPDFSGFTRFLVSYIANQISTRDYSHWLFTGHVFVTSVLLGGQQRTSKYAASFELRNDEVQQDALRGAIGANVNAQYLSASVKSTKEQETNETQSNQKYSNLAYLGMSAVGGDPLIGSE